MGGNRMREGGTSVLAAQALIHRTGVSSDIPAAIDDNELHRDPK
jgi:hypothetical protein